MKTLLIGLVVIYLGMAAYLYLFQRSFIYYPAFTRPASLETNLELVRDGVVLRGWRLNPGRSRALIYFGGNAERLEWSARELEGLFPGHTLYLLAYRGYGDSGGSPTQRALLGDALALYDRVAQDHEEVALLGRSLGSAVAVKVAAERPVARLGLVTPFDSLATVGRGAFPLFPVGLLLKDRYPAVRWAPEVDAPVLVLYAEDDEIVPRRSVERLVAAFDGGAVAVVEIPGTGHNDIAGHPRYRERLAAFFATAPSPSPIPVAQ